MESATFTSARRAFFGEGQLPVSVVRQPVLQSWIRCVDLGLAERALPMAGPMPEGDLRILRQRHETLRRLCRPELEMLASEARETGSVVILADGEGVILDALGDTGFASRAAQVALRPGVSWKEAHSGTNAIGTAIAERKPVAVHGSEHFFAGHGVLSCAATPIIDPRGAIVGVLDISGASSVGHGHALGLIRMAVDQIEHRLFRQRFEGCRVLRFHDDPAMIGTSREGILVFREARLVGGNRRGLALVVRHWDALDDSRIDDLLEERGARAGGVALRLTNGVSALGRWDDGGDGAASIELPGMGAPAAGDLAAREAAWIDAALAASGGNVSQAARRLGIHRSTLHRHLGRRPAAGGGAGPGETVEH